MEKNMINFMSFKSLGKKNPRIQLSFAVVFNGIILEMEDS